MEIVPAIIAKNFKDLKEKIKLVEPYAKTVQLDIMDGVFVPNETWPYSKIPPIGYPELGSGSQERLKQVQYNDKRSSPADLNRLETGLFLEAHLMIAKPHRVLNEWLETKVGRIILHWEALEKVHNHELLSYKTQIGPRFPVSNLAEEIHRCGKEFGVALNPETPVEILDNFINEIDTVLLMSVSPGFAGQEFQADVILKIKSWRQKYPDVKIEVDGGINSSNIKKLVQAGADFLAVGSAIFENGDVKIKIEELENLIK